MDFDFSFHEAQSEIYDSDARFKVVAAGRRFGKSRFAAVNLIIEALKTETDHGVDLSLEEVYYIAPTFEMAKKIMWPLLKDLCRTKDGSTIIHLAHENSAVLTLKNGRRISIKGADRPDSLRGVGLSYVVLDEYADMKDNVWNEIIRPCLARAKGGALFIGTPKGKNHFYELFCNATEQATGYENWAAFTYESQSNPFLDSEEIASMVATMSSSTALQELGAKFNSGGGEYLATGKWVFGKRPSVGSYFIACDLAGFSNTSGKKHGALKRNDDTSIAIVKIGGTGHWFVEEIRTGQWDVRMTALEIIKAYRDYRPIKLGIEKGVTKNAVGPYLSDYMQSLGVYFMVHDLSHGGNNKADRILWALQGRLEKGTISLSSETTNGQHTWQKKLISQAADFPSRLSHDDMLDSLAYIDQLSAGMVRGGGASVIDEHQVFDETIGF